MTQEQDVSPGRLVLEAVLIPVIFLVSKIILSAATYFIMQGYSRETKLAINTPEGAELLLYYSYLITPLAMLATLFMVLFLQKLKRQGLEDIGLKRPENLGKTLLLGLAIGAGVYGISIAVLSGLATFGYDVRFSESSLVQLGVTHYLFVMFAVGWVSSALCEETIFRGFVFRNFEKVFGGSMIATGLAIVFQAGMVALMYLNKGLALFVFMFILALVFGVAFLFSKRNLWPLIIGHGLFSNLIYTLM